MSDTDSREHAALTPTQWAQVRAAAESMLERPERERAAVLDRAAGDDGRLRAEIERLVLACERAANTTGFLAGSAAEFASPIVADVTRSGVDATYVSLQDALVDQYTLGRQIGEGGMATVYLAEDRKHHRPVAIKLLRTELGAVLGSDRFLAEIRVTASLQHPNLLPLFDSGEANGLLYYVMPYVDGETLRARLDRERQLPVADAIRLTALVAGALDYAHRHGVIHRDLKPENILLQDGEPLVADFGIALAIANAAGPRVTQTGLSLGTPQYMSPEQASADRIIDARSDIFSLACVLYEMLTGEPPHGGTTAQAVVARIITEPPRPVRIVRPSVPPHVEAALNKALAKVPADRFTTAREFADALTSPGITGAVTGGSIDGATPPNGLTTPPSSRAALLQVAGAIVAVAAVAGGLFAWTRNRDATAPITSRFVVSALSDSPRERAPVITPDGRSLVYVGTSATQHPLLVRPLDQLGARTLLGTEGAMTSFVSPDGQWIGYFTSDDKLKKVPFAGGTPTVLGGAFRFSRARWGPDHLIAVNEWGAQGLTLLADTGGTSRPLTIADAAHGESGHNAPLFLPGGKAVVFTVLRGRLGPGAVGGELAIVPVDPASTKAAAYTLLGTKGRQPVAFIDGWLVYTAMAANQLLAVPLDISARKVTGPPIAVLDDSTGGIEGAALADNGTLIYMRRTGTNGPMLVDDDGTMHPLLGGTGGSFMHPRLSPDGKRLVIQGATPQGNDVWIIDLASHTPLRLTNSGSALLPIWTPDGRNVLFAGQAAGRGFWLQPADGSAPARQVIEAGGALSASVSPDGTTVAFERLVEGVWEIWTAALAGNDHTPHPLLRGKFDSYMPAISPDGRWLAYASNSSGTSQVYMRPFPGEGAPIQISESGGVEPTWAKDGRQLFYRNDRKIIGAAITYGAQVAVTARTTLFADSFEGEMPHSNFDVMPDGKHFVMVAPVAGALPETVVVLNWLTEFRARIAAPH